MCLADAGNNFNIRRYEMVGTVVVCLFALLVGVLVVLAIMDRFL